MSPDNLKIVSGSETHILVSRANRLLFGGVAVFILATVLIAVLTLVQLHRQVERRVASTTQNLSRSVVQTFDGLIDTIDVALASAVAEIEHQELHGAEGRGAIDEMLGRHRAILPFVSDFRATDEKGDIVYGPDTPIPYVNSADRAYFIEQRDGRAKGLFADKPFLGRISQKWVWAFSRRIARPDGSFAGVVLALVDIDEINKTLATIQIESGGSISLRDPDLGIIARYPDTATRFFPIGATQASNPFRMMQKTNPDYGTYRSGTGSVDGVDRTYSYHRSKKYGFIVNVGMDVESSYAEWRSQVRTTGGLVFALSVALLWFSFAIARSRQRQEMVMASLREAQQIAHLGSFAYDLRTGVWTSSDIFDEIHGIDSSYPRDAEHWQTLAGPDAETALRESKDGSAGSAAPVEREYRILRKNDGTERWVASKGKVLSDRDGNPATLLGTVQDITDRKRTEEELRVAAVAFDSQEAMIITDSDQKILKVNRAFVECTGYSTDEVVGGSPRLLKSGRHDSEFFKGMWNQINNTGGWQGEIWDRRKNGDEYQKWLTISAVKDERGAVTHYVGAQHDISERKRAEERIRELAFFDQLTGLPNRTLLMDRLKQAMTSSARNGSLGALLLIDLDHFKTLNDTLGHDMGDLLLKQVAERMTGCLRGGDTAARIGGDEFVVVLTGLSVAEDSAANQTELVGEKLIAALTEEYLLERIPYRITPSIGASLFRGHQSEIEVLLKQADLAMYRAKEEGRNRLRFFDQAMEDLVLRNVSLERDLRGALEQEQFALHYQAQVTQGEITGAEVLVRWNHPVRGLVSPIDFIPFAEENGLILSVGEWVLETACRQLAAWATQPGRANLSLSVNVSAHQFHQDRFVDQVLSILDRTGANSSRLKLELTESMLVSNVEALIEKMLRLKERGVSFALDDFGTGYSSLYYLKRLPLDHLKIDQSFTRGVRENASDASIVRAIITMAKSLGLSVIAEGVETEDHRRFLAEAGCHAYQGYLFSKPLTIDQFDAFVDSFPAAE